MKTLLWLCSSILLTASAVGAGWTAQSIAEYDALFQRTNGWIGADGNFAVSLTNDFTLWLFSDTFIGEVRADKRVDATLINNSVAWLHGSAATASRLEFFYNHKPDGKPAALITPEDGRGWFWLFDGVMAGGRLFLFLPQFERTQNDSAFGFRQIGESLGEISNPLAPPTDWALKQHKIPFARFSTDEHLSFGSAVLATNGFVYVYGTRDQKTRKSMVLARAPKAELGNFSSWRFRTSDGWSTNFATAANLCGDVANEYSVSWLPALKGYVLICTADGLSDKIIARTAPNPWGPWSAAQVVYRCPESAWGKQVFCYSAKAHPMLATAPDELIVTYAANSFDFKQVLNDARLYWPRFVRVKLESAQAVKP